MTTRDAAILSGLERSEDRSAGGAVARLWLALIALGIALFANQYVTLRKLKAIVIAGAPGDPVATIADKAWAFAIDSWRLFMTPVDLTIAAALVLAAGYAVQSEVRAGTLTALLARADTSRRTAFALLALATLLMTRGYLNPGQVFMGDAETHMLRSWMFAEHLRQLEPPVWSNAWYGGFPLLEHYGPLYFLATALLTLAFDDIHLATKLLLWGCHVGSVFAMFLFLREVTRGTLPALVGAVAYALSFHRIHMILYQGDLQLSILFLVYPLLLLLVERFLRTRADARWIFGMLTALLTVMILNHQGYAFFGMVLLALYVVVRVAAADGGVRDRLRLLVFFGAAHVAALAICAFLLVPFVFDVGERRGTTTSIFSILVPNPLGPLLMLKLFRWSMLGDGSNIGYVGVSIGALALAGGIHAVRRRSAPAVALTACAIASLLMTRSRVHYNVKNVDFFMLFVSALAAWALPAVVAWAPRVAALGRSRFRWRERFPARVAVVMFGLLLLDLGPATFQSVYRENYEFKQPMYQRLRALDDPYKVIERQVLTHDPDRSPAAFFDRNKLGIPSAYAAIQTPLGFFHEGAGRSFGYNTEMVKQLHRDLNEGRISDLAVRGLYLMGVKYVVFRDRYQWFTPELQASPHFAVDKEIVKLAHASPLLLSTRVITTAQIDGYPSTDIIREGGYSETETFDYSGRYFRDLVEPLIHTMGIDMERGVADVLIARDAGLSADLGSPEHLRATVERFSTDLRRVEVGYSSNMDAVGRLPYTYFPYLDVRVDGRPVSFHRSAMNDILVPLPAGRHEVVVRGVTPPMQMQTYWVSLAALLMVLLLPGRFFGRLEDPSGGAGPRARGLER